MNLNKKGAPRNGAHNKIFNYNNTSGTNWKQSFFADTIDFKGLARRLLKDAKTLLSQWLPQHSIDGNEFIALNPTRPDRNLGSFRINLANGMWNDFALTNTKGRDLISLYAYIKGIKQGEAAKELNKKVGGGYVS